MIDNYPVSSYDFNDRLLSAYENLTYLLGIQTDTVNATGLYDTVDQSGLAFMTSPSGIPNCGVIDAKYQLGISASATNKDIMRYLKKYYIQRKYLGAI